MKNSKIVFDYLME